MVTDQMLSELADGSRTLVLVARTVGGEVVRAHGLIPTAQAGDQAVVAAAVRKLAAGIRQQTHEVEPL